MDNQNSKGFSLIELMIVVAIIGVLAAVAIPAYSYFIKASKASDGLEKVKTIADGAVTYFNTEHHFDSNGLEKRKYVYPGCAGVDASGNSVLNAGVCALTTVHLDNVATAGTQAVKADATHTFTVDAPEAGSKAPLTADEINARPWSDIGFQIGGATYYNYAYSAWVTTGSEFAAMAVGSLQKMGDSRIWIVGHKDGTVTPLFRNE